MIQLSGRVSNSPQLAAEGGEGEQQAQVSRGGAGVAAAVEVEVEVEVVVVADQGVAEPVGGHGEFKGQEVRLGQGVIDLVPVGQDVVDDGGVGDPLEEVLNHDVLVVLA
jgi:hypothetical protein